MYSHFCQVIHHTSILKSKIRSKEYHLALGFWSAMGSALKKEREKWGEVDNRGFCLYIYAAWEKWIIVSMNLLQRNPVKPILFRGKLSVSSLHSLLQLCQNFFHKSSWGNLIQVHLLWEKEGANLRSCGWFTVAAWTHLASEAPLGLPCLVTACFAGDWAGRTEIVPTECDGQTPAASGWK